MHVYQTVSKQGNTYLNALIALAFLGSLLIVFYAYSQISLWQHDSAYYDYHSLFIKIKLEGRWLLPFLVYPIKELPGTVLVYGNLLCLFIFFFYVAKHCTDNQFYAFCFACLTIQIPAHSYQMMWPANTFPAAAILGISLLFFKRLPLLVFFVLFGVLFFGTLSIYYYLLPLLFLPKILNTNREKGLKFLTLYLIPSWATGFVAGYLIALLGAYVYTYFVEGTGIWGLEIRPWRAPNKVDSWNDIIININNSLNHFYVHIEHLFFGLTSFIIALIALLVRGSLDAKTSLIPTAFISAAIIAVHYVVVLPIGIKIDLRSVLSIWIGFLTILFLVNHSNHKSVRIQLLVFGMLFFNIGYAYNNHKNLTNYAAISNFYLNDLKNTISNDLLDRYDEVIFLSTHLGVRRTNAAILNSQGYENSIIPWLDTDTRWATAAYTLGFNQVYLCGSTKHRTDFCHSVREALDSKNEIQPITPAQSGLFHIIHGEFNGRLLMYLNPDALSQNKTL